MGNLTAVTLPDSTQISYLVDGQGRRIGKKVNGVLVQGWLWQGQLAPVAELDGSGQVVSRFVYGTRVNVPDYMERGGETYRLVTNHLGSVELVVNVTTGQVVSWRDYDEWGRVVADSNPDFQPFWFAGGLYDVSSGLVQYGERDYDPGIGRWTAKDRIGFRGGDPNLYQYANSDPIALSDPTGQLVWFAAPVMGFLIGGGVDLAMQLLSNGGDFSCIDWGGVGLSAGLGAVFASTGPSGLLFGRGGAKAAQLGYKAGIFNAGETRIGWSWFKGRNWFSLHGGKPYTTSHWHLDLLPGPAGPAIEAFGVGGGLAGGATGAGVTAGSGECECSN
ncbi:MAG: RHS repeat-associated core domain-containing protein [Gemmatimonadetes bacterium]|nr:RHS repeat-associated core domain-containing protein [Gemmatimonadota bacterium]MBK7784970.1 RHS repeat-associated core domain-containing protein [Gemmatimonadota bacterium]